MTAPLDGLLVADFSRVLAGPFATMNLADLGATVVKVERPGGGDDTRAWGPPWTEHTSSYFESVNRSKLGLTLDLGDPADLALARELAARADVLVENFRSGTMQRLGLGFEQVRVGDASVGRPANPGIVYASITGYGSGAGAALPGYDFVVQAVGGLMSITGDPAGPAQKVGVALVDVLTGKDAVIGILAAIAGRARTGQGAHVEVDLLSSLLGALVNQASGYLATGTPPQRMGNRHPSIAPYETLACADGEIAVACGNDGQFRRLAAAVGLPALGDDPAYATNGDRVAHRDALAAALEARLREAPVAHWDAVLREAGVPAGPVGDLGSAFRLAASLGLEPTYAARPGHVAQVRNPVRLSGHDPGPGMPPPRLGEHDALVRGWLTGSDRSLAGLALDLTEC